MWGMIFSSKSRVYMTQSFVERGLHHCVDGMFVDTENAATVDVRSKCTINDKSYARENFNSFCRFLMHCKSFPY